MNSQTSKPPTQTAVQVQIDSWNPVKLVGLKVMIPMSDMS
jgi:hypothetical protein